MAFALLRKNEIGQSQPRSSLDSPDSLAPELQVAKFSVPDQLDPIAVVGFSIKFPQEATSSEALWSMLLEKRCAMTEWPSERANLDAFYHPDKNRNDTFDTRGAQFIKEDLAVFDAPFFSITSAEAMSMDPQHRILLETAYRALENAGIPMEKVSGTDTAVYTASFADDFKMMTVRDVETLPKYAVTGAAIALLANRLSWFFNFKGPCMNIDTACSSSMVALDVACQGLRNRDSRMALVAGSNLVFGLENMLTMSNLNFFSPDGRCYSFDDRANGYSRGEGVGVLVLKRLSEAIADNDTIRAVIRSTGSNQDGRTPGITQPSTEAQARLIKQTYEKAGLEMEPTRFFEAHGTGTAIGDPAEAKAIGEVFRKYRSPDDPLYVGAVKSNIGHLEGSSGIAGVIKTIMVLEKGVIPPNTNFERLNPKIDAKFFNLQIPTTCIPWPAEGLRRASVNSFGFGGSNSHVVLDDVYNYSRLRGLQTKHCTVTEPPSADLLLASNSSSPMEQIPYEEVSQPSNTGSSCGSDDSGCEYVMVQNTPKVARPRLLVWSAADEDGLSRQMQLYNKYFLGLPQIEDDGEDTGKGYIENLAYTLSLRRSHLPWKSFAISNSLKDLRNQGVSLSRPTRSSKKLGIAYVFTGQGAQFSGMGKELLVFDVFKRTLQAVDVCLHNLGCEWSLLDATDWWTMKDTSMSDRFADELLKPPEISDINNPAVSQPVCTALQIALVELLKSFNVSHSAVVGHSSGEIAAAYCVGALSLESACKIAYFRGKLAGVLAANPNEARGSMMSVGLSEKETQQFLQNIGPSSLGVTVACINSPTNVTVSGSKDSIDALKVLLDADNIFTRKLLVDVAYHSPQMSKIADEYLISIQDIETGDPPLGSLVMVSSVSGNRVSSSELCRSEYWVKNMVSPVRFSDAVVKLISQPIDVRKKVGVGRRDTPPIYEFLEIGPHSALRGPIHTILETVSHRHEIGYSSLLVRHSSSVDTVLNTAGRLHCLGYPIALAQVNQLRGTESLRSLSDLPEYPFDHSQKHWYESRISEGLRFRKHPRLDLLGTPASDWNPLQARWRKIIRLSETPWVEDHKVNGLIIYPAAAMFVMAIEAAKQMSNTTRQIKGYLIRDATLHKAVNVPADDRGLETQFYMRPLNDMSEKSVAEYEFRLCTYDSGQWAENCQGTIIVEYEEEETEVDRGNEAAYLQQHYRDLWEKKKKACSGVVEPERVYRHFRKIGMDYGPAFQGLQKLTFNDIGEATAEIRPFDWSSHEVANHVQPHVIHPVTLDIAAQLIFLALTKGARDVISTTVPTRIHELWIAGSGLSHPTTTSIKAFTTSKFKGIRESESSLFALDTVTGDLKLVISSLETTNVASHNAGSQPSLDQKQLCYSLDWKPDIDLLDPMELRAYCEAGESISISEPVQFYQDLSLLLFIIISRTLDQLALEKPQSTKPHIEKYIAWMYRQIEKFHLGNMPDGRPEWVSLSKDDVFVDQLVESISKSKQGVLFVAIGQNLLDMLHGRVDPLSFLFDGELVEDHYQEIFSVPCCKKIGKYLALLTHKNPGLKILEVGAGTGKMTEHVLASITDLGEGDIRSPRYSQYDYTDISGSYFEKAEKRLANMKRVNFKVLNIENDPVQQGFEAGTYDLVIAGLVLHATSSLDVTLQNARKLLKVGGKLILFEIVKPDILRTGFIFGLLPGWWLSSEKYREWSPCVSEDRWQGLLSQNGFSSGIDLTLQDFKEESCHETSVMVSTATDEEVNIVAPKVVLVVNNGSPLQIDVALRVQGYLQSREGIKSEILLLQQVASPSKDLDGHFLIFLLEVEAPFLYDIDAKNWKNLQVTLSSARQLLWVTSGEKSRASLGLGMVTGLARVLRSEDINLTFVTLALESLTLDEREIAAIHAEHIGSVICITISKSLGEIEPEYIEQDGMLHVSRMTRADSLNRKIYMQTTPQLKTQAFEQGPALELTIANPGLLDSLRFKEDMSRSKPLAPHEVEIEVKFVGVNFMDCLTALGRVNQSTMGGECAGIVSRAGVDCSFQPGDRVCAAILDCFKTYVRTDARLVAKIPGTLTFAEASSILVIGITAQYSLMEFARLQKGETILIHSATGGTGQMAVQIAQLVGAEIYATVGSEEKKRHLMDIYAIPEDHIFYSRNASFAQGIKRMTQGRGVDVVLNSLSDDLLMASWDSVASFGRFVEIGKKDIYSHAKLPMFQFRKNACFGAVDLGRMLIERPDAFRKSLLAVVDMAAESKIRVVQPLQVYPVSEIEDALRLMQNGKHMGKIVVEFRGDAPVQKFLNTKSTYLLEAEATYVIAGGFGGIGRRIARWLADKGARNLVLLSRSGPRKDVDHTLIEELNNRGVRVQALACDVAIWDSVSAMIERCTEAGMPPIKGCIQGAMVLRDALFEKMTFEEWNSSVKSKVQGSWNLHALLPASMDFFIMLSSISGIVGGIGQANYAAGNTYEDALAAYRVNRGEKAVSLDLGWVETVGILAENESMQKGLVSASCLMPISEKDLLALLEHYCDPTLPFPTPSSCQTIVGLATPSAIRAQGADIPPFMQRPTYSAMHQMDLIQSSSTGPEEVVTSYAALFAGANSLFEAGAIVAQGLTRKLSKALSMPAEDVDTSKPLHAYGVDSLLAVELRNWFGKEMNADIPIFQIMGDSSIAAVGITVAGKSRFHHASWAE